MGVYLSGGPNVTQYVRLGRVDTDGLDDPDRVSASVPRVLMQSSRVS